MSHISRRPAKRPTKGWQPLIDPAATDAVFVRQEARHEVQQLALLVTWGRCPEAEAFRELRTFLAPTCDKGGFRVRCSEIARELLQDELARLWAHFDGLFFDMRDIALRAFHEGHSTKEAASKAVDADSPPQPPIWLVHQAIDLACVIYANQMQSRVADQVRDQIARGRGVRS